MIAFPHGRRRRCGMTLVEMLVACGLGTIVFTAVASFTILTSRSFAALRNYDSLDRYSRNALDTLTRDIRQVRSLTSYQTNRLVFMDYDGATNLTYNWNPS